MREFGNAVGCQACPGGNDSERGSSGTRSISRRDQYKGPSSKREMVPGWRTTVLYRVLFHWGFDAQTFKELLRFLCLTSNQCLFFEPVEV